MDYPGNGDGGGGNHSPPWDDGTKKRKTTNSAAGRRATAAAEEAERYSNLAPPPPSAETVFASNPFDDSPRPQFSHAPPPPHLPQQLLAAPPRAAPPEYPYGFAPQAAPQPPPPQQARASRAKPMSRGQPPPYLGDLGPVINTKSRMLMGGGNVNVQQHPPLQPPDIDGLSMPPLPAQMCAPNGSLHHQPGLMMPPGPAAGGKPARKRKVCLTPPPVQTYCPPVVWGRDGHTCYQQPMSQLDPCHIGSLPYNPARCAPINGSLAAAPILHGQLTQEPRPKSPQVLDECAGCRELVSSNEEPIWCRAGCGLAYHRRCTNLHETAHYLMTNTPNVAWLCQTCEENKTDIEWIKFGQ